MLNLKLSFKRYSEVDVLIEALGNEKTSAIQYVLSKVEQNCRYYIKQMGLSDENLPDILHDGLILLIKKIQSGNFDATQSSPQTYLVGICKNLILNLSRSKKTIKAVELEEASQIYENESEMIFKLKEIRLLISKMLHEIGAPCAQLIQIKYIDGYSDEEQINQKLTHFTNLDSLRVSRSQCMKKLVSMSLKYKAIYENGGY